MAKRVVQECDLTKLEYDPAETVTIVIKRSGKKTGRTYELSPDAAAKLEQQLVSGNKLNATWGFHDFKTIEAKKTTTIADLENDDEVFIANKKEELAEEGFDFEPRESTSQNSAIASSDGSGCLHMNKGPVQSTLRNKERFIYRICKECRSKIPEKKKDERNSFLSQSAPEGSREGYHNDE